MDLVVIKQILSLAGIKDLVIRFDDPGRQIVATFTRGSEAHTEFIQFDDIEGLFSKGPFQAHTGQPVEEPG